MGPTTRPKSLRTGAGAVYVFRTSDGGVTYGQVDKLTSSDPWGDGGDCGANGIQLGRSVAIASDTIVVGANLDDHGYNECDAGSVYVFDANAPTRQPTRPPTPAHTLSPTLCPANQYCEVAKLTAADAAAYDEFGISVAIAGDTVVIGAYRDDDGGSESGAAYVFRTTDGGATYGQVAKLTAADASSNDRFGISVAVDGSTVVIGAYQ